MSDLNHFEEEEFSTKFDGHTMVRILSTVKPYWKQVLAFVVAVAAVSGAK